MPLADDLYVIMLFYTQVVISIMDGLGLYNLSVGKSD